MKKKYLMSGLAALAFGFMAVSCSSDEFSEGRAKSNAESVFGVSIDPNQDWKMVSQITANVTVNLGLDQQYTVAVYDQNPLYSKDVAYYGRTNVAEGKTASLPLTVPSVKATYYVAVFDSKLRRIVKPATVENGALNVNFGGSAASNAPRRAVQEDYYDSFAHDVDDYLGDLTEAEMKEYPEISDDDIDDQGHIFGTSTLSAPKKGKAKKGAKKADAWVYGGGIFKVTEGFQPADGEPVYIYNGDNIVGKLTFYGVTSAAVADDSHAGDGFSAKLECSYFIYKPLVTNEWTPGGYQLYTYHDTSLSPLHLQDMTTNTDVSFNNNDFNGYFWNVILSHSYKAYAEDNSSIVIYGVQTYVQGAPIDDDGSEDPDNTGGGGGTGTGTTVKHYRVPVGTTITKQFHITDDKIDAAVIYVEGTLNVGTNYTLNGVTIVVADGGKVILDGTVNMSTSARFIVMDGGSITGSDGSQLTVTNGSKCYNAGTIEYNGLLNTNGSDFYNCGTIKVNKLRNTSSNNGTSSDVSKITNFGKIEAVTNEINADAYNCTFINACYWKYTGDAGVGNLTMLDNSRLEVGGKLTLPGDVKLYHASEISCQDIVISNTAIDAPTDNAEFAVLKIARDIWAGRGEDFEYQGNLYADWGKCDQGLYVNTVWSDLDNEWSVYGIIKGKMTLIKEKTAPITIPAGDCTGTGYNDPDADDDDDDGDDDDDDDDDDIPGTPVPYTYAFEDTFMGDYDMNDVVLQVKEKGTDSLDVTLMCTGATYNLYVYLGEEKLFGGSEVHEVLGAPGYFINVGPEGEGYTTRDPVTTTIKKPTGFSFEDADFWIESPQGDIHIGTTYGSGTAPYGIMIPKEWYWPVEKTPITEAYEDFSGFAADREANTDWYEHPDPTKIY